jgi:hypothetical protein
MASASSKSGGTSPTAVVHFCVVACDEQPSTLIEITDTPTATVTAPSITSTIAPSVTSTYSTVGLFSAYPSSINAGACSELSWTVTGARSVALGSTPVNESGTQQVCICETTSYTLNIEWPDGKTEQLSTTVAVTGTCTLPTLTPTTEPQDTMGPSFDTGYLIWEGCKFYGMTDLSDPSGISWAKFGYNLNNEGWLWAWMFDTGSGWQSEFGVSVLEGIGTPIGNIQYQFHSSDNYNNESYSEIFNYGYSSCDG